MFAASTWWRAGLFLGLMTEIGCGALGGNPFKAEKVISKTYATTAPPRVVIDTFNGAIDVTTHPENAVAVRVTKQARGANQEAAEADLENIEVTLNEEGGTIRISARSTGAKIGGNRGAAVEVQLPAGSTLDLRTTNGKISAVGPTSDVTANNSNGGVEVKGSRGKAHLETTNGSIHLDGGAGRVEARTSNGAIDVHTEKAQVDAHTSNGTIHCTGRLADGAHTFQTSNGKIVLAFPPDARFHIDAQTSNGRITNQFGISGNGKDKHHLSGSVGESPAASITARTSNGGIEIRQEK